MVKGIVDHAHAKVIVNPAAGSGLTGQKWPNIRGLMSRAGLSFDYVFTERIGHAMDLAKEAVIEGYELVIAAGGDGTLNEVVNGLVDSGHVSDVTLGILNTGSECDFARFLGIPRDGRQLPQQLSNPQRMMIDVGVVEYQRNGLPAQRCFLNNASVGIDGEVVEAAEKFPKLFKGTMPYVLSFVRCLVTYRNKQVQLQVNGETQDMRILSMVIANGGLFANGMPVAPDADLTDGLFDIIVARDMGKLELLRAFPSMYRGDHIHHPKVQVIKSGQITVQSAQRLTVQADGEFLGEAPVTFRVLPSALSVALYTPEQ